VISPDAKLSHLQALVARLIVDQEAERRRVARDLHDTVGQQVAGISLELSAFRRRVAGQDPAAMDASLTTLQHLAMNLADAVGRLTHDLNPDGLEHLGLMTALALHCEEFQQRSGVEVTLDAPEDPTPIAFDVALCLFRAAQEALRNVAAHAGATRAHVALSHDGAKRTLTLVITDDGKGFDTARALPSGQGFGLATIDNRVRLLNGSLHIESDASGTTVRIAIPTAAR
jgi:two-component system NarL family sensor kinase